MKGALNIYRDNFLEKEELDRLMSFIKDNPALFLFISSTQSFGIIQQGLSLTLDPAFKVEVGTNSNTFKIVTDSYALDSDGNLIYQRLFDNLPIPTVDDTWYWVKISHRYDNYEAGFVDIAADGTLSGVGTTFTDVLRGISSGFPVKLKFYIQEDDGSLTAAVNSGIYEVVSVAGNGVAVISGNFTVESHLRYVVLGAFSIKTSVGAITSTGLYSYDSCNIEFVEEEVSDTPPIGTGFVENMEFYIARVKSDGATVTVQDKREGYYFRINFGDIVVSNKANIDASNLSAPDIAAWLVALDLYTATEIDSVLDTFLEKSQNLNDVANKTTARSNLGVYSTSYIDQFGTQLTRRIVNIGDWDMDATEFVTVAHGVADITKIRTMQVTIRNDDGTGLFCLNGPGGQIGLLNTDMVLTRIAAGQFDSTEFNATAYNRGWIVIDYLP